MYLLLYIFFIHLIELITPDYPPFSHCHFEQEYLLYFIISCLIEQGTELANDLICQLTNKLLV